MGKWKECYGEVKNILDETCNGCKNSNWCWYCPVAKVTNIVEKYMKEDNKNEASNSKNE